jgi:predicted permease
MFTNVFIQVVILFVLIVAGIILTKAKILTETATKSFTDVVLYAATPCVIIKSFIREFDKSMLKNLIISFLASVILHIAFILISRLLLHSKEKSREVVLQFGVIFSNCGYMSIPLQQALLGDIGVFYAASYVAIMNFFVWSYGLFIMSGDKKALSLKRIVANPGLIGLVLGVIIFIFSVPMPKIISEPISYIAALNTPIPMLIIGYHLTKSNILKSFKDIKCILALFIKLILLPLISLIGMYFCGIRGDLLVSLVISCAAPTAAITTMFSAKYNKDTALSVNMVSITTILSLVTMPCIVTLAQYLA